MRILQERWHHEVDNDRNGELVARVTSYDRLGAQLDEAIELARCRRRRKTDSSTWSRPAPNSRKRRTRLRGRRKKLSKVSWKIKWDGATWAATSD